MADLVENVISIFTVDACTSGSAYPCNTTSINVVSLSLICGGLALLMAIGLTKKVNIRVPKRCCASTADIFCGA